MRNPLCRLLVTSLCVLPALAQAELLLGAQLGQQYLDIRQTDSLGRIYEDKVDSRPALGLIVGAGQAGGGDRFTGEWRSFGIGGDVDLDMLLFSYNHFFPDWTPPGELRLRPFVGAELGYGWLEVEAQQAYQSGDDNGLNYGLRTGLNLVMSQRAELELGLRYSQVSLDATLNSKLPLIPAAHYEVRNNSGWWLGFNIAL